METIRDTFLKRWSVQQWDLEVEAAEEPVDEVYHEVFWREVRMWFRVF